MKKTYLPLLGLLLLLNCSDKEEIIEKEPTKTTEESVVLNNKINDFTWKAMNSWYNWQSSVTNLSDSKSKNKVNYYKYLNSFATPEKLFNSLLFQKGTTDRFSWFIEDYIEQAKSFQGINKSFGFLPRLIEPDTKNPILLVLKVSKESPAKKAGLKRGDIIIGINGTKFTNANFNNVINDYYKDTAEFMLGENNGETELKRIEITKEEVSDDAIHLTKIFNNINGKKVGYFVYNGFRSSYDQKLNEAFAEFKNQNIDELILDLRYNGGGSVLSCGYLASLIYGEGKAEEDVFAKTIWNSKHPNRGFTLPFLNGILTYDENGKYIEGGDIPLNRINGLTRVFVITSKKTASASEMIINGLRPYMEVITVGTTTYGKNVGSITLYDSPSSDYQDENTANPSHKNALQPITFKIFNNKNESNYTAGFEPNIYVNENEYWDNLYEFGNENEVILNEILNKIKGVASRKNLKNTNIQSKELEEKQFEYEMYFENNFLINNLQ